MGNTKMYLVQTMDIWSNITLVGVFKDLKDAEKVIKENHSMDDYVQELNLKEYMSTFSPVFDAEVSDDYSGEYLRVFGYIINSDREDGILLELYKEEENE